MIINTESLTEIEKAKVIKLGKQLEKGCKHNIVHEIDENTVCTICNKDLGYFCPTSPDFTCHYFGDHGDGLGITDNEDDCIYCHQPEERK